MPHLSHIVITSLLTSQEECVENFFRGCSPAGHQSEEGCLKERPLFLDLTAYRTSIEIHASPPHFSLCMKTNLS